MEPRLHAPAAARNRQPVLDALMPFLPASGTVLEIASGTGEHAVFFAGRVPHLAWQPSDLSEESLASIAAHARDARLPNIRLPALKLDAGAAEWPEVAAAMIVCLNMIHIAPWAACLGLVRNAARILQPGRALVLYGPFLQDGVETAESNLAFDESLRRRNPEWGIRRLEDVAAAASPAGLRLGQVVAMPANNLTAVFFRE